MADASNYRDSSLGGCRARPAYRTDRTKAAAGRVTCCFPPPTRARTGRHLPGGTDCPGECRAVKLLVATGLWFPDVAGGLGRVAAETARRLAKRGHDVMVI